MKRLGAVARRAVAVAGVVVVIAAIAGCGGATVTPRPSRAPAAVTRLQVGAGATGAVVLRTALHRRRLPVVIFLHGLFATSPGFYGPWLAHLAREGNEVIYPTYQNLLTFPQRFLPNAVRGIRAALHRVPGDEVGMIAAGHSAGGALAADYAASAVRDGLPPVAAIFAAYPGRRLRGIPLEIPVIDPRSIPREVLLRALAGDDDHVVGEGVARALVRDAMRIPPSHRRFVLIRNDAVDDHRAPQRADAGSRATFWLALDRLISAARRR